MSPSEFWTSFKGLNRELRRTQKIEKCLLTADFEYLCQAALHARSLLEAKSSSRVSLDESVTCSVDTTKFSSGWYNVAVELKFSDSERWIARIRLPSYPDEDDGVEFSILSEITTMRYLSLKTSLPVPHVYGFDVSLTNPFGYRYMLMEAMPGRTLPDRFHATVPKEHWDKLTDQLSDYYYQLSCLRFSQIGYLYSGPNLDQEPYVTTYEAEKGKGLLRSSLDYFWRYRKAQTKTIAVLRDGDETWAAATWILELSVPSMVIEDRVNGPFSIFHEDFTSSNVLVDEDFNITAILDWTDARTGPIERLTITHEIATFHGGTKNVNTSSLAFREKFVAALRKREQAARKSPDDVPLTLISDYIGTPSWEIVYHTAMTCNEDKAVLHAEIALEQMFGCQVKFENFVEFYKNRSFNKSLGSWKAGLITES